MPRTGAELKDIVHDVEQPFLHAPEGGSSIRQRIQRLDEIVDTRYDYEQHLSPMFREHITMSASLLRHYRNVLASGLRNELRLHLEPTGNLKREESAADRLEVAEARQLLVLNPDNQLRETIHQVQAIGYFWAGWLEMAPWVDPNQAGGESNEDYDKRVRTLKSAWSPYQIVELPSDAVAFVENDRKLTLAVTRYKLPVIDILERFGGAKRDDSENLVTIWNESFSWLRSDRPQAFHNAKDFFQNEIEIIRVADDQTISYCVDRGDRFKGRNLNERFRPLAEGDYDNPFGDCPLLLCEGVYLADRPVAYRRESMLHSLAEIEHGRAIIKSTWASQVASPPWLAEEKIPKEVTADDLAAAGALIDENGLPQRFSTWGEFNLLSQELDQTTDKLYQVLTNEAGQASPEGLIRDAEGQIRDVGVSVQLANIDERKEMLGSPAAREMRMWSRVLDMVEHAYKERLNQHRTAGQPSHLADWPIAFHATGKERVKGRNIERGQLFEIKPQDLDYEYTRTLEPIDDRLTTRAELLTFHNNLRMSGGETYDDFLEGIGIEDIEAFKEEKFAETLIQMDTPKHIMAARMRYAQFESQRTGKPIEEVLAAIGVDPAFTPESAAGDGGSVNRFGSPATQGITSGGSATPT